MMQLTVTLRDAEIERMTDAVAEELAKAWLSQPRTLMELDPKDRVTLRKRARELVSAALYALNQEGK